jgi:hypothetical protein
MADEDGGLTLDKLTEFLEDFFFCFGIKGTTGFIKNEDLGITEKGTS